MSGIRAKHGRRAASQGPASHAVPRKRKAFGRAGITVLAVAAVGGAGLTGLAAQADPETGKNLVSNGSFTHGTAGWSADKNARLSSAQGRDGAQAVRVTSSSGSVALSERRTPVEHVLANHTYTASAWVRVEKTGRSVALRLLEKSPRATVVGDKQSATKPHDTQWKKITTSYTARTASSSLDLHILGFGLDQHKGIVIDDVTLVDTTPGSSARPRPSSSSPAATAKPASPSATAAPTPKASAKASAKPTTPAPAAPTPTTSSAPAPAPAPSPTKAVQPAVAPTATASAKPTPAGWKLAWSDEFNGTSIDRNAWTVENNSTYGDGNNELACLMDRPENIKESGGVLTIAGRKESTPITCGSHDSRFPNGRTYTSAMINSKNKMDFEYGRFEMRAKLPTTPGSSKGLWPAYWMRPTSGNLGELDILEVIGTGKSDASDANRVHQTIHYDYVGTHPQQANDYRLPSGNFADGFHDFAVEWEPGSISWYVDGVRTYTRTTSTTSWIDEAFSGDFYLRLNMAIGGDWNGAPDADTAFPANYQVDYVRVYQR